ncbi:MAG TPA: serine/threonine-protein kinase [Herpetosiphonaceae bacterium]|nr:serine/threonine-protein kinase [Herpetosiphonaceae bacterium]
MQATQQRILCPICRASNRGDARFCQQCGNDVLLDNIYRLTKVIKEGGMGMVYKAIDAAGAEYAIKEMHDRFANQTERDEGIQRFIEEAELLHNLNHPAIPKVYRSFIDEGRYYLSMEFIYGEDLEDVLKRVKSFPEPTVMRWADQLCDVLEYMHEAGLIYRDMKPANIMIDRDDNVKLVDFGIAKVLQPGQRNTMVGTPGYAPPEQYQGLATRESDLYALAATLHHLLTGRDPRDHPPFTFPLATTIRPEISLQTAKALDKALEMEVAQRFPTVEAFRRALPIPTGDRRPTLPFDLPRGAPARQQPASPSTRQPGSQRPRQPVAQPAPARSRDRRARQAAPPRPAARPRRSAGRMIRRAIGTAVLAAGIAGAGVTLYPEVVPMLRNVITQLAPADPAPANPAPNSATFVTQSFDAQVSVTLPEGTSDADILAALRQQYEAAAQTQYPGARINPATRPGIRGGNWQAGEAVNGQITYTADMFGSIDVPQQ